MIPIGLEEPSGEAGPEIGYLSEERRRRSNRRELTARSVGEDARSARGESDWSCEWLEKVTARKGETLDLELIDVLLVHAVLGKATPAEEVKLFRKNFSCSEHKVTCLQRTLPEDAQVGD